MSKEAEILKTGLSCHDTLFAKNQVNQGEGVHLRWVGPTETDS